MAFVPYGDMLHNYYQRQFDRIRQERKARLEAVRTAEDAAAYRDWAKKTIREAFGPLPEKTPLNSRITSSSSAGGIITETVLYESRPGLIVSGMLCRPEKSAVRLPAVIGLCGHAGNGKNFSEYHTYCVNLAARGFIALLSDPIAQGERRQFDKGPGARRCSFYCCPEHNQLGKMLGLFEENFAAWRLWDAIRGVDYLLERPDVDPARLGVTGNSGGGTLTGYLWAMDERLTMAAPNCFLTTYYHNYDNELPTDAEQNLPGLLAAGFEMADFLICRAPQPAVILAKDADYFDPRGAQECYEDAEKIFRLLGAPENVQLHIMPGPHSYDPARREIMYEFFARHAGISAVCQPELPCPPDVLATATGNVNDLPGAKPMPEFVRELAELPRHTADLNGWQKFLREKHHVAAPQSAPDYKFLRPSGFTDGGGDVGCAIAIVGVKTEPGILAVLHTLTESGERYRFASTPDAVLYVADFDAETELRTRWPDYGGDSVFSLDVRGSGKSQPLTADRNTSRYAPYATEYFYDATGMMLNDSLWGGRCRDVLAALKLLRAAGAERIRLCGCGQGAMLALGAALAAPELCVSLELEQLPPSLRDMVRRLVYRQPQSFAPRGMLLHGDFADMIVALPIPVRLANPGSDMGSPEMLRA